ncbi:hypothetical protein GTS_05960 [Gandjariella thermophila]|uniref:Uncharacterized protein n=1 Tax=Gandjariella thermophila TaxID=1931992 RepID=A0A4D4J4T2_9PSEU|nr:hypothetical protein GTS_05960 [Gandjariella thermophila]
MPRCGWTTARDGPAYRGRDLPPRVTPPGRVTFGGTYDDLSVDRAVRICAGIGGTGTNGGPRARAGPGAVGARGMAMGVEHVPPRDVPNRLRILGADQADGG